MSSYEKQAVIFSKFVDNFADLMKTQIFRLDYLIPLVFSGISSGSLDLHTGETADCHGSWAGGIRVIYIKFHPHLITEAGTLDGQITPSTIKRPSSSFFTFSSKPLR